MKLIFLDTETTSLSNGRLVQLAYEIYDSDHKRPGLPFECKYKPPVPIEFEAMAVHHITEKMVADLPEFKTEELGNVFEKYLLVAHNAPFDMEVLEREGIEKPKYWIDTKKVAQFYIDLPAYNLQYLRYRFGLDVEAVAHDAAGDIAVLKAVFFHLYTIAMQEENKDRIKQSQEIIGKMVNISKNPVEIRRFNFGKHKGKYFEEVAKTDVDYLLWLRKDQKQKEEKEQDKDLLYTLSLYL